jgi:hypothetical protein
MAVLSPAGGVPPCQLEPTLQLPFVVFHVDWALLGEMREKRTTTERRRFCLNIMFFRKGTLG